MYGAGDVRIENVPDVVAVSATAFIEDASKYLIFGRR